jgi:hypothetical protein
VSCTGETYAAQSGEACRPCPRGEIANDAHTGCTDLTCRPFGPAGMRKPGHYCPSGVLCNATTDCRRCSVGRVSQFGEACGDCRDQGDPPFAGGHGPGKIASTDGSKCTYVNCFFRQDSVLH